MKAAPNGRPLLACAVTALACLAAAPAALARFGDTTLRKGSSGHDVRVLQSWLDKLGYSTDVDGSFGSGTLRSVRRFEKHEGLKVDGVVDPPDIKVLRQAMQDAASGGGNDGSSGNDGTSGSDGTTGSGGPAGGDGNQGGGTNNGGSTVGTVPVATTPGAKAHISSDGHTAVAPANAPAAVQEIIAAANEITNTHYRWGGGHGSFNDTAYDCSGAVSHALHGASLLRRPLDSTDFESWGSRGRGKWVTVYANSGHAYLVVAGLRFDTSGSGEKGPRWRSQFRSSRGYVARHPRGL